MKRPILYAMLLFALAVNAYAEGDAKQEIIKRCKTQMGGYSASMVKACVDQDIQAINAINKMPEKHNSIVARCMSQMRKYGFSMVKCADQDIEAEEALSKY